MYQAIVPRVLEKYGAQYEQIHSAQKGYRNESYPIMLTDGSMANLMFYKRETDITDRIHNADAASEFLAKHGMPTRVRLDRRTMRLHTHTTDTFAALYNYLPGNTIPWEAYTQAHIKLLGKTLSDMHAVLKDMPTNSLVIEKNEFFILFQRMSQYFADKNVQGAMRNKLKLNGVELSSVGKVIKGLDHLPNQQVLHMDFVRGNVLFDTQDDLHVSGILDFEKATVGHPLLDIARTLAFLLVDCKYKTPQQVRKYFLYSGYEKRGNSQLQKVTVNDGDNRYDLLEILVQFFLLHDFYKFLKHNPYESLSENEHFVRTRDILIQNNMVHYV